MNELSLKFAENISKLWPFKHQARFAVAVSGGADSFALLILMHEWVFKQGHKLIALTVDHGLRPAAAIEANYVKEICDRFSIEHHTLKWQHNGISSNIQERAREARYELLTNYCKEQDILSLLTAHHADDRLENFFIRLSRGSGIMGLAEHNLHFYNNVQILRPLFNFSKEDCYQLISQNGIKAVEDPFNSSDKYLRSELRGKMKNFFNLNTIEPDLFKARILSSIENFTLASKTIEKAFLECLSTSIYIHPEGFAIITLSQYNKFAEEEKLLTLSHILTMISGQKHPPRYESLKQVYNKLITKNSFKTTIHSCIVDLKGNSLKIYREYGKSLPEKVFLKDAAYWDNRFLFRLRALPNAELFIDYCTEADYKTLDETFKEALSLPKQIIFTLPAIKSIEKLVAIPHINYYSSEGEEFELNNKLSVKFKPSFISRLTHYVF